MDNLLFIMTDQQRTDTLGCYGSPKVDTPYLDNLAAGGVRFDSAYVTQPVCAPCRSSMRTGLYPHATRVLDNNLAQLDPSFWTWPAEFQRAGYRTCYVGKWHLGWPPAPDYFDDWHGYDTGWPFWLDEGKTVYRTDEETDWTINWLERNKDRPFCCTVSYYPPHTPKTVPEEALNLYRGRFDTEEQDTYYAMVHRIDWNVGRLLDTLDRLGLRENTLVVFASDHGENYPLRWNDHLKRLCYDQSARVPLLVSRPGTVPRGETRKAVLSLADLGPTFCDFCGLHVPDDIHGKSIRALVMGEAESVHEAVFIQNNPCRWDHEEHHDMRERAVVTDKWKLILNNKRGPELYHRPADPKDEHNLFGDDGVRQTALELMQQLEDWGREVQDELAVQLVEQWKPQVQVDRKSDTGKGISQGL